MPINTLCFRDLTDVFFAAEVTEFLVAKNANNAKVKNVSRLPGKYYGFLQKAAFASIAGAV
jgi:hypothetical protein